VSYLFSKKIKFVINYKLFIIFLISAILFQFIYNELNFELSEYNNDLILGTLIALLFIFDYNIKYSYKIKRINVFMSEFSYSIYAFHMPIIFFMYSVFDLNYSLEYKYIIMFFTVLTVSRILFYIGENNRNILKSYLIGINKNATK